VSVRLRLDRRAVSLKGIERSYGLDFDGPAVQNWIESLLAGEWAEDDGGVDG
jgi:hypothetical protein